MRVTALPLFLYSLSLAAVVAGQSTQLTDGLTELDPVATPTETSTTQGNSDTETSTSTSTEEEPTSTSTSTSSDEPTTTDDPTTTTDDPTTTTDDPTTTTDDPTSTTDAPTSDPTTTSGDSSESETQTPTPTTITTTQTIDGTPVPTTFTTSNEASESTESPGLSGSSEESDSGLDSNQTRTIIGVVVGVGGAILIGAIGVVVWRIRARRRAASDDDVTDLMSGTAVGSGVREKAPSPAAGSGGTPFRSTLDQYHNPGPVNAASNF
ncbi:hypothetical protein BDW62DRAFT_62716 [Aspergillus aurantiobrunneus]